MTAIRDRQSDPDAEDATVPWDERLVVGERRGLPWWAAVLVGFGLAVLGAIIDEKTKGSLDFIFKAGYFVGAVLAVGAVQRRALFGPMVQPPLVLAVTVPGVVLLTGGSSSGNDTLSKLLNIGTPLINGFPTMAITTGVTLLFGFFRIFRERDPDAAVKLKDGKPPRGREDGDEPPARPRTRPPGSGRPASAGQAPPPAGARRPPRDRDLDGPPPRRPRPPADPGARPRREPGDPAAPRGARKPPPDGRRPRPPEGDPRRRDPRGDAPPPRRRPRADEPPPGRPRPPRREPPRRQRPWDDES
ncbi:DUF6542 domain-containing protein [Amycolatopsis sp. DSM 110486]|uniref:DUF6542 domain-containing protein n=2 Tax=unclassified Amycolatopsis TaxID=2618356 RepID=UPI001C697E34|nr:DUF6542 domain-containing protein [Amycolatopsis sp. DSM 110486]QYN22850.1 hypothetical protein K1T34_10500 [Amycolatopsis sp. DSM 110486]